MYIKLETNCFWLVLEKADKEGIPTFIVICRCVGIQALECQS